jgi:glycosyltransferase involved in cell wall biosynthesis
VTDVHVVVPEGIDDPARPSGGNTYDRRLCDGLAASGWGMHEHAVPGGWPRPAAADLAALEAVAASIPDGAVVLLDGLIASTAPEVLVAQARRLRMVVLVHMPLCDERERAALSAAAAIVTTSEWSRDRVVEVHGLRADRVHAVPPGVDAAGLVAGSETGEALLCVAAVTAAKGHDLLLDALAGLPDLSWRCLCLGSLDREPEFANELRRRAEDNGLRGRVSFAGPRTGAELDRSYAAADVIVLASRSEAYGMVVTEALARGLPVVAADVGGVSEALGRAADGTPPGLLVAPEDPAALGAALRAWLGDAQLRERLRAAARDRRGSLAPWTATTFAVAAVLAGAA